MGSDIVDEEMMHKTRWESAEGPGVRRLQKTLEFFRLQSVLAGKPFYTSDPRLSTAVVLLCLSLGAFRRMVSVCLSSGKQALAGQSEDCLPGSDGHLF